MKDSGIEWIGEIPENWTVLPNKYLMHKEKNIQPLYNGEDILSLTMNGVIIRDLDAGGKMPASFDGYQKVKKGNLLMCLFDIDVTPRCVGLIKHNGLTSPAYSQFILNDIAIPEYYCYYYTMLDNDKTLLHLAKNLRHSLTDEQLGAIPTVVPPISEQIKIANFLDKKYAEIDLLVNDIQQQIEILEQYKRSVITEAVTKGIDPNVEMKDSGIKWVSKIPMHWKINKLKYVINYFYKGSGITREDVILYGNIPCVRYGEIYSKYDNSFKKCVSYTNLDRVSTKQFFKSGDILFACTGELVEEIGKNIVYLGNELCLAGGDIIIANHFQNPSFLNYALNSIYVQSQKSYGKAKLKVVHISAFELGNIAIALPDINEQEQIANYLDKKCIEINCAISDKKKQIKKLEDYKKTIVYEYVTGKKAVSI